VLSSLARTLKLDRHERDHLFHLAGHGPSTPTEEPLAASVATVPLLLQPNAAYIIDAGYDVLSHNQATEDLFPELMATANFARWVFTEPVAREVLVDWAEEARGLLARLRTLATRHPHLSRLTDDLREASQEVRDWWPRYDVQARHGGRKRLRRPDGVVVEYTYTAFHLAEQPDNTLVVYVA
jgi:hypothetical protein